MDEYNDFGFSSTNIHQHLPIRRFSQAARVEEHHQFLSDDLSSWELLHQLDDQIYPTETAPVSADSMEEFQFVDSFFNIDHIYNDDASFSSFFPEVDLDSFLMADDNGDFPMMMELEREYDTIDMSSSYEEDATSPEISMQPVTLISATVNDHDPVSVNAVDDGLQLVHLLLACAEAVGCRDTQLADSILSQIWYSANPLGDSLQRVSYCFAMGLKSRLTLLQKGTISMANNWEGVVTREEKMEAFHLLHQMTPYISFGFMAANDAILQAAKGKEQIHIIDLGMEHTLQWPSLIRTLTSTKLLRITGILGDRGDTTELESEMERLVSVAKSVGIEVQFRLISGPATPAMLTRENLQQKEGELLFVNSILHLHTYVKESRGSLKTILQAIKKLGPTMLTVVEQDANHNGPFFLGRFLESLHYYSAIFDSLEAKMGRNSIERMKIERNYFAEEIRNIVAYEGTERVERHERADQWRRQLGRAGFQVVAGKKDREAAVMKSLGGGDDGYTVGSDQKGHVLLGWKGRPIMLAAAWQPSSST